MPRAFDTRQYIADKNPLVGLLSGQSTNNAAGQIQKILSPGYFIIDIETAINDFLQAFDSVTGIDLLSLAKVVEDLINSIIDATVPGAQLPTGSIADLYPLITDAMAMLENIQKIIDAIATPFGIATGAGSPTDILTIVTNLANFLANPNLAVSTTVFNVETAVQNFVNTIASIPADIISGNLSFATIPAANIIGEIVAGSQDLIDAILGAFNSAYVAGSGTAHDVEVALQAIPIPNINDLTGYLTHLDPTGVLALAGLAVGALPAGITLAGAQLTGQIADALVPGLQDTWNSIASALAPPAPAAFSDNFTRANASTLGSNWTTQWGVMSIVANAATSMSGWGTASYNGTMAHDDMEVAFTVGPMVGDGSVDYAYVILGANTAGESAYGGFGAGQMSISTMSTWQQGGTTSRVNLPYTPTTGDVITLKRVGNVYSILLNGTLIPGMTWTDSAGALPIDGNHRGLGIMMAGYSSTYRNITNWQATDLGVGAPTYTLAEVNTLLQQIPGANIASELLASVIPPLPISQITSLEGYLANLTPAGLFDASQLTNIANIVAGIPQAAVVNLPATVTQASQSATDIANMLTSSGASTAANFGTAVSQATTRTKNIIQSLWGGTGTVIGSSILVGQIPQLALTQITGLTGYLTNLSAAGLYDASQGFNNVATSLLQYLTPSGANLGAYTGNLPIAQITALAGYLTNLTNLGVYNANLPISQITNLAGYLSHLSTSGVVDAISSVTGLGGYLTHLDPTGVLALAGLAAGALPVGITLAGAQLTGQVAASLINGVLGLPNIPTGIPQANISGLVSALAATLTATSPLNAQNLFNQVPQNLLGMIPYSNLGASSANLITNPGFDNTGAITNNPNWTWNNADGHTTNGCAQTTANGTLLTLVSNIINVAQGQQLTVSAWVKYTGLAAAAGTNALRINIAGYLGTAPVSTVMVAGIASPTGSSSGWTQLSGNWTVPSGVDNIVVQLQVTADATAGTVEYDDASATKTGLMSSTWMTGISGAASTIAGDVQAAVDNIWNATSGVAATTGNELSSIVDALQNIPHVNVSSPAALPGDIGNALQEHVDAGINGILNAINPGTPLTNQSQTAFQQAIAAMTAYLGFDYVLGGGTAPPPPATSIAGQVASNQNRLRMRAVQKPSFLSIDPTADSVFPISSQQGTTPNTVNATSSTAFIGLIGITDGGIKSAIWWYQYVAMAAGMSAVFKVYKVNTANGSLGTAVWTSASVSGLAAGWQSLTISPSITTNAGEWYAVEIAATGSGNIQIVGIPGHWLPAHPTAFPASMGMSRALPSGTPAYSSTVPWFALAGAAGPQVFAPVLQQFTANGTYTPPTWANNFDILVLGGGGGGAGQAANGGAGWGGNAGGWATPVTLTKAQVAGSPTFAVTVGGGGWGGNTGGGTGGPGGNSSVAITGYGTITGPGGSGGVGGPVSQNGGAGASPGNQVFNGNSYYGGGQQNSPQSGGNAPGGGGAGGNGALIGTYIYGGAGAGGSVWILAYQ